MGCNAGSNRILRFTLGAFTPEARTSQQRNHKPNKPVCDVQCRLVSKAIFLFCFKWTKRCYQHQERYLIFLKNNSRKCQYRMLLLAVTCWNCVAYQLISYLQCSHNYILLNSINIVMVRREFEIKIQFKMILFNFNHRINSSINFNY